MSVAYAIPEDVAKSPILGQYMRTDFGQKYLALLAPRLVGNVAIVSGQSFNPAAFNSVIAPLQITTLSLPGGTHAVSYAATMAATGGVGQYAWTKTSGTLPPGLALNATLGTLTGTPTLAGTYYFQVTVTDIMGNTAEMNYQVIIA